MALSLGVILTMIGFEITNIRNINPKIPIRCLFNNGRVRSIAEISKNIHVQEYVDSTGIIEKIAPMNQS
jgi:hypothetical protein